ncbi:MAG: ribosome small subunit-dependent GTPase A [Spirochaetes bacterium]|jgi:ribosome biogenesis GTPase|nr:ribosome small subunit-dependent GTPase A [Spirochaetota bacterium]
MNKSMANQGTGIIVKVFGLYYTVDDGDRHIACFLKGKNRINKQFKGYTNPVAVGDNVVFQYNDDGSGSIIDLIPRKNLFSRKDKGRNAREDVIAANLDILLIIQAFVDPVANPRFVDRLAVRAIKEQILPVLCMNKLDLATEDMKQSIQSYYKNTDLKILLTSAEERVGIEELQALLTGKRTLLAGFSGVGKSSLINTIYNDLDLAVADISDKTGKGRHTTTNVIMYQQSDNTQLIDSPGVREFGLVDMEPADLSRCFYEFNDYSDNCNFANCTHEHEPGCNVKKMVDEGVVSSERYVSYLNMLSSLVQDRENRYR